MTGPDIPLIRMKLAERQARIATAYLPIEREDPLGAAKGIAIGAAICIPAWLLLLWGLL